MLKKIILLLVGFCALPLAAEVSVISVTDEDKHTAKEDFAHTFEYYVLPAGQETSAASKCQATRISRRWFVTAAHCVTNCKNGCKIQLDLMDQTVSGLVSFTHTPKRPLVFADPEYSPDAFVKHDFALLRLDLSRATPVYYRRGKRGNVGITKAQFDAFIGANLSAGRAWRRVQSPSFPPLVVFDRGNYLLDRKISVISIFDGVRAVKKNPHLVHYVKNLGFAYTNDFGIIKGMSGSGVMTNTGELIGLISGTFQVLSLRQGKKNVKSEYFMFFVFNHAAQEFMKEIMGSDFYQLDIKDAYPNFVTKSRRDYSQIVQQVQAAGPAKPNAAKK
ncbi:MAG: S1 family peptidase [Elusimicrobiaceae bacterium]|nr:S1 family peptidase [Elusimicrobiaceae bacterium]